MSSSRARTCALLLGLAVTIPAALAFEPVAHAQPSKVARDEAATRFRKGIELFKEGDYRAALIEFKRAYELAPHYSVLYNIGQVNFQLQDYAGALSALDRYLVDGGNQVSAARRDEVKKDIEKLRARVATVEVVTNVPDAEITIDDVVIGKSPLTKPVIVSSGRRRFTATREGHLPASKLVDIAGTESIKVTLDLPESAPGQTAPPVVTPPPPDDDGDEPPPPVTTSSTTQPPPPAPASSVPWIGWGVTGGLTVGAVIFGVLALSASSDLEDLKAERTTRADLDDARSKATTLALVTDILAGCAVVAGGVSVYFTVRRDDPAATGASPPPATVRVGVTPGGVRLLGTF